MLAQKAQREWTLTPLNHELRWKKCRGSGYSMAQWKSKPNYVVNFLCNIASIFKAILWFLPPANEVWGKVISLQASVCPQGGSTWPGTLPPDQLHPPGSRHPPRADIPSWDQVHPPEQTPPCDQVHPPEQTPPHPPPPGPGTPPGPGAPPGADTHLEQTLPGTRYTPQSRHPPGTPPWDQVHPLEQTHPPQDQVHPPEQIHSPGPGTPPRSRHPPGTRYTPRSRCPPGPGAPPRPGTPPEHAGRHGQRAGGPHPTGMQSCHKYNRSSRFWNLWMKFMCLFSKLIAFINSLHRKIYCGTLPNMEKVWPGSMSMVVWRIASKWISCASLKFIDVKLELLNQWNYHVTWRLLTPLSMFMAQNSNCKWWQVFPSIFLSLQWTKIIYFSPGARGCSRYLFEYLMNLSHFLTGIERHHVTVVSPNVHQGPLRVLDRPARLDRTCFRVASFSAHSWNQFTSGFLHDPPNLSWESSLQDADSNVNFGMELSIANFFEMCP